MEQFTVVLRGEPFVLYRDQIDFDAPNYFTALFTSDFAEAQSRRVELSRSPELFRFIVNYLSGYEILPLDVPPSLGMSPEAALRSLLVDAVFYGLDNLATRLRAKELQTPLQRVLPDLELLGLAPIKVDLDDLVAGRLSPRTVMDERGLMLERDRPPLSPVLVVAHDIPVIWDLLGTGNSSFLPTFPIGEPDSKFGSVPWTWEQRLDAGSRQTLLRSRLDPIAQLVLDGASLTGHQLDVIINAIVHWGTGSAPSYTTPPQYVATPLLPAYLAAQQIFNSHVPIHKVWSENSLQRMSLALHARTVCFTISARANGGVSTEVLYADLISTSGAAKALAAFSVTDGLH